MYTWPSLGVAPPSIRGFLLYEIRQVGILTQGWLLFAMVDLDNVLTGFRVWKTSQKMRFMSIFIQIENFDWVPETLWLGLVRYWFDVSATFKYVIKCDPPSLPTPAFFFCTF